jgi:hypothetical protein
MEPPNTNHCPLSSPSHSGRPPPTPQPISIILSPILAYYSYFGCSVLHRSVGDYLIHVRCDDDLHTWSVT